MYSFVYAFSKYLLNTHCVPSSILGSGNTVVSETEFLSLCGSCLKGREISKQVIYRINIVIVEA